jgi:hypothetical protein
VGEPQHGQSTETLTCNINSDGHRDLHERWLCQVTARRSRGGSSRILAQAALA